MYTSHTTVAPICEGTTVVNNSLQHAGVEAPPTVIGAVAVGWADHGDVGPIPPDALGEAQGVELHQHLQGVVDLEQSVPQHILKGATDL